MNHADILYLLGKEYDAVARHADALDALGASLDLRKVVLGPQHESVVKTLAAMARLNRVVANYDKAEAQLTEASAVVEQTVGVDHLLNADVVRQWGRLYGDTGRDELSLEAARRDVEIRRAHDADPLQTALSLTDVAGALIVFDDLEEAQAALREALAVIDGVVAPDHPQIGSIYYAVGTAYLYQDELRAAETALLKAVQIQRAGLGDTHPALALSLSTLGAVYRQEGRYAEAEAPMLQALNAMRANHPEAHRNVSFEKVNIAELYRDLGRLDDAERMIDDAVSHYLNTDPGTNTYVIYARWLRAEVLAAQGRFDEAGELFKGLFQLAESLGTLQDYEIEEYAQSYAEFLTRRGEAVTADDLAQRLRGE